MIFYVHGPRINNETGMTIQTCFRGKKRKENSTKRKKNEHGDICYLNNFKPISDRSLFKLIIFDLTLTKLK